MTTRVEPTICRNCGALCPVLVTFEDDRPVKVVGDPDGAYEGYSCPKGRALPEQYNDPRRLLMSQKRLPDGSFVPISSDQAVDEIAKKIQDIVAEHGPRSVAAYFGSGILSTFFGSTMSAFFMQALGSPMIFTASSIDKPGEKISLALHGNWHAGWQTFDSSDTWVIVGANPIMAKSNGAPTHNPGMRLKQAVNRGMKLIVIDPRRTETTKRAHVHLQAKPGEDPTILAGMIHIIIAEGLYDQEFLKQNAVGFEELKRETASFTPDYVAERAGISVEDLLEATRTFARGKRGMVSCSTGPSFSTHGNLTFYLGLCINTLLGRWGKAGDQAASPNVLLPAYTPRAQPQAPYSPFGNNVMHATGLRESAAGMPVAALSDEILYDGPERVRVLLSVGGNPISSWPDQRRAEAAMKRLDLMVQMDIMMSATARFADYIIASPMAFEAPFTTYLAEMTKYLGPVRGSEIPWAQYTPALVKPPPGSDVIAEHAFMFRVAKKMGLKLKWANVHGTGKFQECPTQMGEFDMDHEPSLDEMWELLTQKARVPLERVKQYPHGNMFDLDVKIAERSPDCTDMLQVGDPMMMEELRTVRAEDVPARRKDHPFQLVSRRMNRFMNSQLISLPVHAGAKPSNPLFVHPDDLKELNLSNGQVARVTSPGGEVLAVAEADPTLRRGVVAMSHGFGGMGEEGEADPRIGGTNVNLLISLDEMDSVTGLPRMSAIPVAIERAEQFATA